MSRIGLIGLLVLLAGGIYAQQDHFVLIQTGNDQPFYVRMGEQTYNSTTRGHLILAQLRDSSYSITIGFPQKLFPEEDFSMVINKKDLEFQLKYVDGKGWELLNRSTLELLMPAKKDIPEPGVREEGVKKDDPFSRLMAGLVSDTAVMYTTYSLIADSSRKPDAGATGAGNPDSLSIHRTDSSAQKLDSSTRRPDLLTRPPDFSARIPDAQARTSDPQAQRSDSLTRRPDSSTRTPDSSIRTPDSLARTQPILPHNEPVSATVVAAPKAFKPRKTSVILKISEQNSATAHRLAYTDHTRGRKTDTIDVSIPIDTASGSRLISPVPLSTAMPPVQKDSLKTVPADGTLKKGKEKPVVVNSDCRNFASDEDVDRLKGKWQTIATDEGKITAARKAFKLKCFSTNQLKALSETFTLEAAKYRFLESAYPFVSDDHFRELYSVFADPVYIGKFKTLVGAGSQ